MKDIAMGATPFVRILLYIFGGVMVQKGLVSEDDVDRLFGSEEVVGAGAMMVGLIWWQVAKYAGWNT